MVCSKRCLGWVLPLIAVAGCSNDGDTSALSGGEAGEATGGESSGGSTTSISGTSTESSTGLESSEDGPTSFPPPVSESSDDGPDVPDEWEPTLQWSFGDGLSSEVLPLVANLTDDDGDGSIDLCDVPDVVLITLDETLWVLDGATGEPHGSFGGVFSMSSAAIADLDVDGTPEIITSTPGGRIAAWTPSGTQLWMSEPDPNASN